MLKIITYYSNTNNNNHTCYRSNGNVWIKIFFHLAKRDYVSARLPFISYPYFEATRKGSSRNQSRNEWLMKLSWFCHTFKLSIKSKVLKTPEKWCSRYICVLSFLCTNSHTCGRILEIQPDPETGLRGAVVTDSQRGSTSWHQSILNASGRHQMIVLPLFIMRGK